MPKFCIRVAGGGPERYLRIGPVVGRGEIVTFETRAAAETELVRVKVDVALRNSFAADDDRWLVEVAEVEIRAKGERDG